MAPDRTTAASTESVSEWGRAAGRHLWGHFSAPAAVPIIERADGCHIWDDAGHRLLDGLAGLFVTQVGHGRTELAKAAYEQMNRLAYFPLWGYGHPAAAELAERLAGLAPGDPEPGVLHERRQRGGRVGPGSWPASTSQPSVSRPATRS